MAILGLKRYVLTSEEGLLIAARKVDGEYDQHLGIIESVKECNERRRNERSNVLKQKKLHGQFLNQITNYGRISNYVSIRTGQKEKRNKGKNKQDSS